MCFIKMYVLLNLLLVLVFVEDARSQEYCQLDIESRVQYCFDPGNVYGLRRCSSFEAEGVILRPECSAPSRYSNASLPPTRCINGKWVKLYTCKTDEPSNPDDCKLDSDPSVRYDCIDSNNATRSCKSYEPAGTVVMPACNSPAYYSRTPLPLMRCSRGKWDIVVTCIPDCGKETFDGEILGMGGKRAQKGEVPWHAGIYDKTKKPYRHICGGTLVSTTVVITAAHCFWQDIDGQQPAANYAVAVDKLFRSWNHKKDYDAQKSDVRAIHVPQRFHGGATNFQDDIAVVEVVTAFEFNTYLRPACLDFDESFERLQLETYKGKAAGWGLDGANGTVSPVLKVTQLMYIDIQQCLLQSPAEFTPYITSDKICARHTNGTAHHSSTALCKGDSGGGLSFPGYDKADDGVARYYLRGIASTAPSNENLCNIDTFTAFTRIIKHERFIRMYL